MNTEQKAVDVLAVLRWASVSADAATESRECDEARAAVAELIEAGAKIPDDVDMIEFNRDEGQSFFCCGEPTHLNMGKMNHAAGCWLVRLRGALSRCGGL